MNKKVLWTMIVLMWMFLICFAVIKLFFAEWFVTVVENDRILQIGSFIDRSSVVTFVADCVLSVFVWHFYLCSCLRVWRMRLYQYGIVSVCLVAVNSCYIFIPNLAMCVDLVIMLILPVLFKADCKQVISIYVLHSVGQMLMLFIRSEPLYFVSTNYATQFFIMFDVYVWLILYYLYSNLYKEERIWENLAYPFSVIKRKMSSKKSS